LKYFEFTGQIQDISIFRTLIRLQFSFFMYFI